MIGYPREPWWRRRRPLAVAVLLVALAYPASFVPACWVLMRSDPWKKPVPWFVIPLVHWPTSAVVKACPRQVRDCVRRAIEWGSPEGIKVFVEPSSIAIVKKGPDAGPGEFQSTITAVQVW